MTWPQQNTKHNSAPLSPLSHLLLLPRAPWDVRFQASSQLELHINQQSTSSHDFFHLPHQQCATPSPQQNSPMDLELMTSPTINYNKQSANTTTPQSPDNSKGIPSLGKPSCNDAMHSLATLQIAITNMQHHTTLYLYAHIYTNFHTMHDTHVLPGSIWHHHIQCYQLQHQSPQWGSMIHLQSHLTQFLPEQTLSNPNISTLTITLHNKTQCHIITGTEVTTALLPDLPLWYQNLPLIIYYLHDAGRPGPPWPPPTKFLHIPIPTANTDPLTDHSTATRPSHAWQPTDHLTHEPLHAIALSIY